MYKRGEAMEKPSFDTMKKGYNRYQVDDYVQTSQQEIASLNDLLNKMTALKKAQEQETQYYKTMYDKICDNLNVKENAASDMTRIAMKEANMIVNTAHRNADVVVRESLVLARELLSEIAKLANEANSLKGSMREELLRISQALDDFETPEVPNMDLLKKRK